MGNIVTRIEIEDTNCTLCQQPSDYLKQSNIRVIGRLPVMREPVEENVAALV